MSRNFELLQRVGFDDQIVARVRPASAPAPARRRLPVAPHDPHVDAIVQRLFFASEQPGPEAVTFVAISAPGETISTRVARALADHCPGEVCFVDANPAYPVAHEEFGLANSPGLAEALGSVTPIGDYIRFSANGLLAVLTSGESSRAPDGVTLSQRLMELRELYRYVLVRISASVHDTAAANAAARSAGNAVLVLEAQSTRRDTAARVKSELERCGVSVRGAVLTNRTFPIPQVLYSKLF